MRVKYYAHFKREVQLILKGLLKYRQLPLCGSPDEQIWVNCGFGRDYIHLCNLSNCRPIKATVLRSFRKHARNCLGTTKLYQFYLAVFIRKRLKTSLRDVICSVHPIANFI